MDAPDLDQQPDDIAKPWIHERIQRLIDNGKLEKAERLRQRVAASEIRRKAQADAKVPRKRVGHLLRVEGDLDAACRQTFANAQGRFRELGVRRLMLAQRGAELEGQFGQAEELSILRAECNARLSRTRKVVVLPIPKNACSSLKESLVDSLSGTDSRLLSDSPLNVHSYTKTHLSLAPGESLDSLRAQGFKVAVVIRNPFKRLVSAYLSRTGLTSATSHGNFARLNSLQRYLDVPLEFDRGLSFAEFVQAVAKSSDEEVDEHWRQQVCFLPRGDVQDCDVVCPFEKFQQLIEQFAALGLKIPQSEIRNKTEYAHSATPGEAADILGRDIRNASAKPNAKGFYRDDLVQLVADRYAKDIALYEKIFGMSPAPY